MTALRNIRLMHALERIATQFEASDVPLMTLKGAALQLKLYDEPDDRPMADLDLLVRPQDVEAAILILEDLGGLRSEPMFREDFFPRFYYEIQFTLGHIHPITIDLHVRPLRPLRLARLMPDNALWARAEEVALGATSVLIPAPDDMLLHLAAHSAFHGNDDERWLVDLRRWVAAYGHELDWNRLVDTARRWHLVPAFMSAILAAEVGHDALLPSEVRAQLQSLRVDWRDRLALWHAPRDLVHMTGSAIVNAVTTPGWRFRLAYFRQVLLPDRAYMDAWSDRHQCRWRPLAVFSRIARPLLRRIPFLPSLSGPLEVRKSGIHGHGVFATRSIAAGTVITRYKGPTVERDGTYVAHHTDADGREQRHEITGPLRFLNHYCRPNAELVQFQLIATLPIREGDEVTIDYGEEACECARDETGAHRDR